MLSIPGNAGAFVKTEGAKFVDGDGKEFVIKGMGFYNGNPESADRTASILQARLRNGTRMIRKRGNHGR